MLVAVQEGLKYVFPANLWDQLNTFKSSFTGSIQIRLPSRLSGRSYTTGSQINVILPTKSSTGGIHIIFLLIPHHFYISNLVKHVSHLFRPTIFEMVAKYLGSRICRPIKEGLHLTPPPPPQMRYVTGHVLGDLPFSQRNRSHLWQSNITRYGDKLLWKLKHHHCTEMREN